jgi:hypothetical protein
MRTSTHRLTTTLLCILSLTALGACGGEGVSSDEEARRAYLGLDPSIAKSLTLGFAGFNAATSANIPPQTADGDATGTLTISGQVDSGASDNKEMRLYVGMVDYSDGPVMINDDGDTIELTFDTSEVQTEQPYLHLALRAIPTDPTDTNGTFTGELTGTYVLSGDIVGDVTLNLTLAGEVQTDAAGDTTRVPGTTTVTGTAIAGDGTYAVDLTI